MKDAAVNDELWQTRAAAWELAALSLRYPGSELAEAAAGGEWDEAAGEILAALGLPAEVPAAAGEGGCDTAGPAGADALLRGSRTSERLQRRSCRPASLSQALRRQRGRPPNLSRPPAAAFLQARARWSCSSRPAT